MPYMETKSTLQSRTTETIKLTEPAKRIQAQGIPRYHRRGYLTRDRIIFGAQVCPARSVPLHLDRNN